MSSVQPPLNSGHRWIAFESHRLIHHGAPEAVASALHALTISRPEAMPVVFDDRSSQRIELVWQMPLDKVNDQVSALLDSSDAPPVADDDRPNLDQASAPRSRGRPKLGVVPKEVTLLPIHWAWLSSQPGGASVMLRKLVHNAMKASPAKDSKRQGVDAAYRFMSVMASDQIHFEEASRSLYASDLSAFLKCIATWPADIRSHLTHLAISALSETQG